MEGALGDVRVTDTRGAARGSYTVTVVSSPFTTGTGESAFTIPAGNVVYTAPASIGGTGTATRGRGAPGPLGRPRTAMTATGTAGTNTSVWNPTITIKLPADAVAGTYTGTITHSVA